jgi:hypothetical protein
MCREREKVEREKEHILQRYQFPSRPLWTLRTPLMSKEDNTN